MTKEEIKDKYTMRDIILKYSLPQPNRAGFMNCPFHNEKTASFKVYKDSFYCFGCGKCGDIFNFIQEYLGLSFKEAYAELGGEYEQTFSARMRANKAINERRHRIALEQKRKAEISLISNLITVYRENLSNCETLTDDWCYYYNKLQYQIYLWEINSKK